MNPKLPYQAEIGLSAVTVLGHAPNVAVVRTDSPVRSASDFLTQARAKPGRFTYGSAGNGTSTHLAAELLKTTAKVFVIHVPYRGATPAMTDLIGGKSTRPSARPAWRPTRPTASCGVGRDQRRAGPCLTYPPAEAGLAGYAAPVWYGILWPAAHRRRWCSSCCTIDSAAEAKSSKRIRAEGLTLTLDAGTAGALPPISLAEEGDSGPVHQGGLRWGGDLVERSLMADGLAARPRAAPGGRLCADRGTGSL
jgi:hypothetical protein